MDKMRMESVDMTAQNIDKIAALFPNCITETKGEDGKMKKAINFDMLKQMLSGDVIEGDEAYEFTWVGKKASIVEANKPIRKTLRPCKEESVNWDTTENLYIEGDNLEVLKLLQESYLGKVKMIYIDPPYNTGSDSFVYPDNYTMNKDEYEAEIGLFDEEGKKLFKENNTANPRFHSDWCSMMYSRLMLARNLLCDNGVIFISIDDSEQYNLRKIVDEVFGASNFIATCVRKRRDSQANLSKNISPIHEYVMIYAKRNGDILHKISANIDESDYKNPDNDPRGPYKTMPCTNKGGAVYTVTTPTGSRITEEWRFKEETYYSLLNDNRLVFPRGGEGKPRYKLFLSEKMEEGQLANTWLGDLASNQEATRELKALFGETVIFDTPKPIGLLEFCIQLAAEKDSIILDFFSGSATTAHAVMQMNAEDGGHRKFIMVQLPEKCNEASEAYKAGYKNICEIGKERIRRAANKIAEENSGKPFDGGFRVFKLDDSNMKDVFYAPAEYDQNLLSMLESNIKEDRTDLDLLFGCLLEWGLPLSMPYTSEEISGCTVHTYNDGDLIACFDENIPDEVVKTIAKRQPLRAVFRDSSFNGSPAKINVTEVFKLLAPDTRVKVI